MIFTGAIVNFITVVAGTLVGLVAGKFLNERIRTATMSAVALITIGIAVPGLMSSSKPLVSSRFKIWNFQLHRNQSP